jgi:hypothetical protein
MKSALKTFGLGAAVILLVFLLSSCSQGVSREEADDIRADIEKVVGRISEVEDTVRDLDADAIEDGEKDALSQDLRDIASRLESIEGKLEPPEPAVPQEGEMAEPMEPQNPAF